MIIHIKKLRKNCGYTQQKLADICGVTRNTISSLEKGEYKAGADLYTKLCFVLKGAPYSLTKWELYELRQSIKSYDK